MVGDRESDVRAGLNAGIRAAGVCTGEYDEATWQRKAIPGVSVHADFAAFAKTLT
jgi:phosphoglycolate phosphatase-like HAD superfamily hydrolase